MSQKLDTVEIGTSDRVMYGAVMMVAAHVLVFLWWIYAAATTSDKPQIPAAFLKKSTKDERFDQ